MSDPRPHPQLEMTPALRRLLASALKEDLGAGDVTTRCTVPVKLAGRGELIAKASGVLCGAPVANALWRLARKQISIKWLFRDGEHVSPGDLVAELRGPMRGLLIGERTALNFLQRLSGVASLTQQFVKAAGGPDGPVIVDTRKTAPLWRVLQRYAVRIGGGANHRFGLFDMILIKENHARAAGGLREAIQSAKRFAAAKNKLKRGRGHLLRVAAEARNLEETAICCAEKVDLILLDNFTPAQARQAVQRFHSCGIPIEISGGVNLKNIAQYAKCGPDRISIGALTHSAQALDLSLQLYQE